MSVTDAATGRSKRSVRGLANQANPAFAATAVVLPLGALAFAVGTNDLRLLGYVHVMAGVLWTGIDLFMGIVVGPVVGGLDVDQRAGFFQRFTPKMTFLMPVLSLVTIAGGITLAMALGKFPHAHPWLALLTAAHLPIIPLLAHQFDALTNRRTILISVVAGLGVAAYLWLTLPIFAMTDPWIVAALVVITLLAFVGFGLILPGEIKIYFEAITEQPDNDLIGRIGLRNARLSGIQGLLQLTIIYVMVNIRF